jgi:hypothetical protein
VLRLTHTLEVALASRLNNQHIYSTQFDELVRTISAYSRPDPSDESWRLNPFAFLTSTNTLGQTLFFAEQATVPVTATEGALHHPLSLALAASRCGKISFSMRHLFSLTVRRKDPWPMPHTLEQIASTTSPTDLLPSEPLPRHGVSLKTMRARLV